jgi:hypothetical protein
VQTYFSLKARQGKSVFSLLALVLFLFVSVLASAPECHEVFHHDAGQANHQCAATVLSHGQVDITPVIIKVTVPICSPVTVKVAHVLPRAAVRFWLQPERAPPLPA